LTIDRITISDQVAWSFSPRKCIGDLPKNDDLGFKSPLGAEQRDHEARQELQTIDHLESDYLISGLKPLRMKFSVGQEATKRLVGIVVLILNIAVVFTPIPLSNAVPALVIR
jgi:hypothetical protein